MLQRNTTILWRELDHEAVLLDPKAGCSYNLNTVGTFIWKMLDGHHSSDEIATALCQTYEVTYEQALLDVESLLIDLRTHHLISETTSPAQNPVP